MDIKLISVACIYYNQILNRKRRKNLFLNPPINFRKVNKRRSVWSYKVSTHYFDEIWNFYSEELFLKKYRMSRGTFNFLCEQLGSLEKQNTRFRNCVPLNKRIAISLHLLKSNCDHATVADLYGVGESTAKKILLQFCNAVSTDLRSRFIKYPNNEETEEIVKSFENIWGFPGCVGALDGSHIPIMKPVNHHTDYFNYKKYQSIILLALADHKYLLRYINVGQSGRNSDATVFERSTLHSKLSQRDCFQNKNFHIISDGAFSLETWNMKPYTDTDNLSMRAKNFNYRLSRARMVIECVFGRLKGRWRILNKKMDHAVITCVSIISACCVLHNICESKNNLYYDDWNDGDDTRGYTTIEQPEQSVRNEARNSLAAVKRRVISQLLTIE